MREKWTDERLDDLSQGVDRGFESVGRRFDAMERRFDVVERRFDVVERRFEGIDRRIDKLLYGLSAMFITGFIGLASLIVSIGH